MYQSGNEKKRLAGLLLALAQTITASIYGTVITAEGLVIEGVKVTPASGHLATRTVMTGARAPSASASASSSGRQYSLHFMGW